MRRIIMTLATALASALVVATSAGEASAQVAPEWVEIVDWSAGGSGCPAGSVFPVMSPDNLALTLKFREFDAQLDPTLSPPVNNGSEFCNISVLLNFPAGFSYSLISATYKGRVDLGPGTIGQQTSEYWFQGAAGSSALFSSTFMGFAFGPYSRTDQLGVGALVWSPCGVDRYMNIDADVSVSNSSSPRNKAYMNVKTADIAVDVTYGITWRFC